MNENTTLATTNPTAITTLDDMERVAINIAGSGMFGITKKEQAITLMLLCQAEGLNPISALRRYHIIEGRPSMRADAMQGEFESKGGAFIFHARSEEIVAATAFIDRSKIDDKTRNRAQQRFELLMDLESTPLEDKEARKKLLKEISKVSHEGEDTLIRTFEDAWNKGISVGKDGKTVKANWATSPRQMLTARVVTELVRLLNPGLIAGIYTEDETADIIQQERKARLEAIASPTQDNADELLRLIQEYDEQLRHDDITDGERKRLQGQRMELVCKLDNVGVTSPKPPEPPAPTVGGHPATRVETTVLPPETTTAPKATRTRKPAAPAEAEVQQPEPVADKPWREVVCTRGKIPGSMNGKTLGQIFLEGRTAPKSVAAIKPLVDWFVTQAIHTSSDPVDRALWKAVQEAEAELRTTLADTAPASAPATTTTPEAPKPAQAAPSTQRWQDFVIPGKHPEYSGKKMGDFGTAKQLAAFKTGYIDKIDWNNATLEQKRLKAMAAMALEEVAKDGTLPAGNSEPEAEPEHTQELRRMIESSSLNRNDFMAVCRSNAWIDADADGIEDIAEDEVMALQREWAVVSKTVKAAQP